MAIAPCLNISRSPSINSGRRCPTGLGAPPQSLTDAVVQDWLEVFERAQLILAPALAYAKGMAIDFFSKSELRPDCLVQRRRETSAVFGHKFRLILQQSKQINHQRAGDSTWGCLPDCTTASAVSSASWNCRRAANAAARSSCAGKFLGLSATVRRSASKSVVVADCLCKCKRDLSVSASGSRKPLASNSPMTFSASSA